MSLGCLATFISSYGWSPRKKTSTNGTGNQYVLHVMKAWPWTQFLSVLNINMVLNINIPTLWWWLMIMYRYGVGSRIRLKYTRAIIDAIHSGDLNDVEVAATPIFDLKVPTNVKGVPTEILEPSSQWNSSSEYNSTLNHLADLYTVSLSFWNAPSNLLSKNCLEMSSRKRFLKI